MTFLLCLDIVARNPAAIIFDLDGVLANSTPMVEASWRAWCAECLLDADRILRLAHGRRKPEILAAAVPHVDAEIAIARLTELETAAIDQVGEIPGAADFVRSLPAGTWAIATSGERAGALQRLKRVGIPVPRVLVSAEDVARGKPHPDAYLQAAAALAVDPAHCVVFEDAIAGVEAALAAGMTAVALETTYSASQLWRASAVVRDFHQVQAEVRDGTIVSIAVG